MARSVLLVDDDPSVLRVLRRYFERSGWETFQALSGEDGVRTFDAHLPDLVLLDVNLPGISGLHVLEVLIARGATVVMLTGQAEVGTAVEAMRAGAEGFLTKPVDLDHLGAAAERAVEKVELRRANHTLAERVVEQGRAGTLGASPRMRELTRQVELLASSQDTTLLLQGESGTGKSWVAQLTHGLSPRARAPFVEINCAGLSATFLDSELFGHEKGAFTDAREMKRGLFEVADRGTLFLDEIGDLSPDLQPKLLRVLETRTFRRLGGTREIQVDVRLIAATNKDLAAEVRAGRFREDLFYRLSVFLLTIPPLRERSRDDVLELVHESLRQLHLRHPGSPDRVNDRALELLLGYAWPGNVRELRNVLERALVLSPGADAIGPEHLPEALRAPGAPRAARLDSTVLTLEEVERQHIERTLYLSEGNRTLAAQRLAISRATLHAKIKQYGLERVGRDDDASA
ncbi:MAG: sigma-54-dependent Fis family transcriptional regulator [Gemmatimonadetes bacterium]|nr:sigma-54-dependent Fis family transcriptional regulator [Gemmatimonadota bacterium]